MTRLRSRRMSEATAASACNPSYAALDAESSAVISMESAKAAGCRISIDALRSRVSYAGGGGTDRLPGACAGRASLGAHVLYGFAVHALKSASDTFGSFRINATMDQISLSSVPIAPKLGIAVILMPFLTTQNSWAGWRS